MIGQVRKIARMVFPQKLWGSLSLMRRGLKTLITGVPGAPMGTDWVGYEALIAFMRRNGVLKLRGDLLEIGTFLGGGARKLAGYVQRKAPDKKLYVLDIFDPEFDLTLNLGGSRMADIYREALTRDYPGQTQREIFDRVTEGCANIAVLQGDSKTVLIPDLELCFAFIDGNHDADYVENDFYLAWNRLVSGGCVAFHDYGWDLPQTTEMIDSLVQRHGEQIGLRYHDPEHHVLFLIKV